MKSPPTRIDRYPAKMVGHLAEKLILRFAQDAEAVLDPFCGSGALLLAAKKRGLTTTGVDINPYAVLLTRVKLDGFNAAAAARLADELIIRAKLGDRLLPVSWRAKSYWFTPATLRKYERLRFVAKELDLHSSPEGRAVLLSYALSIRRCSRADPRSPKPFISRQALLHRSGMHYDPTKEIRALLRELSGRYGTLSRYRQNIVMLDMAKGGQGIDRIGLHTHVLTSPPYINAQDYFRNFKLELYFLEGLIPFRIKEIRDRFIGTERGALLEEISQEEIQQQRESIPQLYRLEEVFPRLGAVVHRYFHDMGRCFDAIRSCMKRNGVLVLVCGDNLVGGRRIETWRVLNQLLKKRGFALFDIFRDRISCRNVPPTRCGHKGIIKAEVVSAFRLAN